MLRSAAEFYRSVVGCLLVVTGLASVLLLSGDSRAWGAIDQSHAAGLVPRQTYDSGGLADINLYNLNLVVAVPLSPQYPLNQKLPSYGLTAYYNGALRWATDGTYSSWGFSLGNPDLHGWLGAGWRMDFGKVVNSFLLSETTGACLATGARYMSPGGGVHPFNSPDTDGSTTDGSHLQVTEVEYLVPGPNPYCPVPTEITSVSGEWKKTLDPNTGQVVQMMGNVGSAAVDITYMGGEDFDPNADPSWYDYDSPWPEIIERSLAIKSVTDSYGRVITTSLDTIDLDPNDQAAKKYVLKEVNVPVFGNAPGVPTGVYTLHYEVRQVLSAPPGWPPLDPASPMEPFPYLVRIELPADAAGNRLTYVFDYNEYGEMVEIRTPQGGLTQIVWGTEDINPDDRSGPSLTKLKRVVTEKRVYPDPYGAPSQYSSWMYTHNPYPLFANYVTPLYDRWRTIVTDPVGNSTEYRYYTTESYSYAARPFYYPGAMVGAVRVFKGPAPRYTSNAQYFEDLDPNYSNDGTLVRGIYTRYGKQDPNAGIVEPIHVEGTQTVYYDDKLTPSPTWDPETIYPGTFTNYEMEFDLTPTTTPTTPAYPEGWATSIVLHDPNQWKYGNFVGTQEEVRIYKGNLVGNHEIRVSGADSPCSPYGPFPERRSVWVDGNLVELTTNFNTYGLCLRKADVSNPLDENGDVQLENGDVYITNEWIDGFVTGRGIWGGLRYEWDSAPGAYGFSEDFGFEAGVLYGRKFQNMDWWSVDRDIDVASGLASATRDTADVQTNMVFDALGRIILSAPESPEHSTSVTYVAESEVQGAHVFSRVTEKRTGPLGDPGELLERREYDGQGRLERESHLIDDGSAVERDYFYNVGGQVVFESTWHDPNQIGPQQGTSYTYVDQTGAQDSFGRPLKISDASGAEVALSYFGMNETRTISDINVPPGTQGGLTAVTTVYRDYMGNTRIVDAPEGADAVYEYDYAGRLTKAILTPSFSVHSYTDQDPNSIDLKEDRFAVTAAPGQERLRAYDSIGRLRSSTDPESGETQYVEYDALGRMRYVLDSANRNINYVYDEAGRNTEVRVAAPYIALYYPEALRIKKVYADSWGSYPTHGQAWGKLVRVEMHDGTMAGPALEREFFYQGLNGRLSEEKVRIKAWGDPNSPWITTKYGYDGYGQANQLTHPLPDGSTRIPTTLKYAYSHGYLSAIESNKATADPNVFTTLTSFGYDQVGARNQIDFENGFSELWFSDVLGRTNQITLKAGTGNTVWSSGIYSYDGAGNIIAISPQQPYAYDTIGRLTSSGTQSTAGPVYSQEYTYDIYGSMLSRTGYGGTVGDQEFTVNTSTNRLNTIRTNGYPRSVSHFPDGAVSSDGIYSYLYGELGRLQTLRFIGSGQDVESYAYDDRGWRWEKDESFHGRTTWYFRGADGQTLTEYAFPSGSGLEPHWKKDYIYGGGRHIAAIENMEPDEPSWKESAASDPNQTPWVSLGWNPSASLDAYGYHIYRAHGSPTAEYKKLTGAALTGLSYQDTDPSLIEGDVYYYKLSTEDSATVESRLGSQRKITPGDDVPPNVVTGLTGDWSGAVVVLGWTEPQVGPTSDLVGYRVYRKTPPNDPEVQYSLLSGLLPKGTSGYTDNTANNQTTYRYQIRSVDTANNESVSSPTKVVFPPPGGGPCSPFPCFPERSLLLPPCRSGTQNSEEAWSVQGSFCFPGEQTMLLADHTGGENDYRIISYHVDHLGTPRLISNEDGLVLANYALFPYGEEAPGTTQLSLSSNTHWFTGHERDLITNIDSLPAREYQGISSRFTEPDPSTRNVLLEESGTWNMYGYSGNSPVSFVDPDGLAAVGVRPLVCGNGYGPRFSPGVLASGIYFGKPLHAQIFFEDTFPPENVGYFSDGTVRPDDARNLGEYTVLYENLDDKTLREAVSIRTPEYESGSYKKFFNNCQHFASDVLDTYWALMKGRQRIQKCKGGDVETCKKIRRDCENRKEPEAVCREYEKERQDGNLPAHMQLNPIFPFVPRPQQ
jgi:RHS repeat-associated protein